MDLDMKLKFNFNKRNRKMKKSKRYIKKQNNKPLINKKVLAKVIRESNICQHAIKELKLAGYGKGEGGQN